jgi:hypothetical protein
VVWAIRRTYDWNYNSAALQWPYLGLPPLFAMYLLPPGYSAALHLLVLAVGFCFFCSLKFAYHLISFFIEWPTVEGRIGSVAQDGSRSVATYSFELGKYSFGGRTTIESISIPHM